MYKVITYFTDMQDNNHPYNVGDTFPRVGKTVSESRLKELSGINNRQNKRLIAFVGEKEKKQHTRTEINRMPVAELKKMASELGVADGTGAELKESIIAKLGL